MLSYYDSLRRHGPEDITVNGTAIGEIPFHLFSDPDDDFMYYIQGGNTDDILDDLSIAVHEECHGFTSNIGILWAYHHSKVNLFHQYGNGPNFYHIADRKGVAVKVFNCFPPVKIDKYFPHGLKPFAYSGYTTCKDNPSAPKERGVFWLLDEWNSYNHDSDVILETYYFKKNHGLWNEDDLATYWDNVKDNVFEPLLFFRLYISYYLLTARKEYPHTYDRLVANRRFALALKLVRANSDKTLKKARIVSQKIVRNFYSWGYAKHLLQNKNTGGKFELRSWGNVHIYEFDPIERQSIAKLAKKMDSEIANFLKKSLPAKANDDSLIAHF